MTVEVSSKSATVQFFTDWEADEQPDRLQMGVQDATDQHTF